MKISIITVCYNAEKYIKTCIDSVLSQDYKNIEYIIVDGNSKDGTVAIIKSYGDAITKWISEPDKGLYDAMNKGLAMATGEIIGFISSDDILAHPKVISTVASLLEEKKVDTVFADVVLTKEEDLNKTVRFYSSKKYKISHFEWGMMPAHLSFYAKKELYDKYGNFDTQFRICADYDLLMRFLYIHKSSHYHHPEVWVKMRTGGISNQGFIKSTLNINKEIMISCKKNQVPTNWLKIYSKYFTKIFQLIKLS